MAEGSGSYLAKPVPSGLADVVEVVLSRGLVIDAHVRVSLLGIELVTVDARIVVASVDTYLRFAEATNRLDLVETGGASVPEMVEAGAVVEHVASTVVERKTDQLAERATDAVADVTEKAVGTVVDKAAQALLPEPSGRLGREQPGDGPG